MIVALFIFLAAAGLMMYSYALYPPLLEWLYRRRDSRSGSGLAADLSTGDLAPGSWPRVSILMAVYNEEAVIEEKINSVFAMEYPRDRLLLMVGSDGSDDGTDALVRKAISEGLPIELIRLEGRNGKAAVLNALAAADSRADMFLLTDANVLFDRDMLRQLVIGMQAERVALVGAFVLHPHVQGAGISHQESQYIARENRIKYLEGELWGSMMGAFGACYLVRKAFFPVLPPNTFMEDFYVTMHVLSSGKAAIACPGAKSYEDLPHEIEQEFRRKIRISTGNYQNISSWSNMLWRFNAVSFCFWSHKVLRWMGPFLLLACWLSSAYLMRWHWVFGLLWLLQTVLMLSPLLDRLLGLVGLRSHALRLIGYFYSMNLALFAGFIQYLKGVRSSAWQPTARNFPHGGHKA